MSQHILQVPQQYFQFMEKTLLMCLCHNSARVYSAEGNTVKLQQDIKTEATEYKYTDNEGYSARGGKGRGSSRDTSHNREHYDRVFLNYLSKKLHHVFKKGNFERMTLVVPADMKKLVRQKIPRHILAKTEFVSGNMVNARPMDVIRKLSYEMTPETATVTEQV